MSVESFDADRAMTILAGRGVARADGAGGGLSGGAMKARLRMRGPESGGAPGGTPELYFGDPDGIVVQLQDVRYCGGAGVLGDVCAAAEPSPRKGLLAVRDLSHFTITASDSAALKHVLSGVVRARRAGAPGAGGASPRCGVGRSVPHVHGSRRRRRVERSRRLRVCRASTTCA